MSEGERLGNLDARVENCEIEIDRLRYRIHEDIAPKLTVLYLGRVVGPIVLGAIAGGISALGLWLLRG